MTVDFRFDGCVAVVTGSARGIGASIARSLADAGSTVVVTDIDVDEAENVAVAIRNAGGAAVAIQVDVSSRGAMMELADVVYSKFGKVDILCNNAGVTIRPFRAVWEASMEDFDWIMRVNYFGVVNGLAAFLPRMLGRPGHRHIVNTSSMVNMFDVHGHAMYASSKAAIDALSDALRSELVDHGEDIGVTVLLPGPVRTEIAERSEELRPSADRSDNRHINEYPIPNVDLTDAPHAIDPDQVGPMLLAALRANAPYCLTHPVDRIRLETRVDALVAGYGFHNART